MCPTAAYYRLLLCHRRESLQYLFDVGIYEVFAVTLYLIEPVKFIRAVDLPLFLNLFVSMLLSLA